MCSVGNRCSQPSWPRHSPRPASDERRIPSRQSPSMIQHAGQRAPCKVATSCGRDCCSQCNRADDVATCSCSLRNTMGNVCQAPRRAQRASATYVMVAHRCSAQPTDRPEEPSRKGPSTKTKRGTTASGRYQLLRALLRVGRRRRRRPAGPRTTPVVGHGAPALHPALVRAALHAEESALTW